MSVAIAEPRQLSVDDVDFYNEHGYLRLKQVFDPQELTALSEELDHIIQYFATHGKGWSGPWRKQLMQSDVETKSLLVTIHELQSYSAAWARALVQERLVQSIADIIGPELEFHHSTLHAKGPIPARRSQCTRTTPSTPTRTDATSTPSCTSTPPMRRAAA